ncbi:unnamed protein product [Boreogadus saida]
MSTADSQSVCARMGHIGSPTLCVVDFLFLGKQRLQLQQFYLHCTCEEHLCVLYLSTCLIVDFKHPQEDTIPPNHGSGQVYPCRSDKYSYTMVIRPKYRTGLNYTEVEEE